MKTNSTKQVNLSENLKKLSDIASWFDEQQTVDVEEGLVKVKQAATLIKESRLRLKAIENEFTEIKKDIDGDQAEDTSTATITITETETIIIPKETTEEDSEDIPF